MDKKPLFKRYLIGPRQFAQGANVRDFVGAFTTSCEAKTRIVSQRRANTVIGGSTGYCRTELFQVDVANYPIPVFIVSLMYVHYCRFFIVLYVLYCHLVIGKI